MNFLFTHDGHTYAKHSECPQDGTTQVLCDDTEPDPEPGETLTLEPSGDPE